MYHRKVDGEWQVKGAGCAVLYEVVKKGLPETLSQA